MRRFRLALRALMMAVLLLICAALFYLIVIMGGVRPDGEPTAAPTAVAEGIAWMRGFFV